MQVAAPLRFDARGRTAAAGEDRHLGDLVEAVLLTSPGERVNRPGFGSALGQMLFAPNADALAAATQMAVQAAIQEWLGDLLEVQEVSIEARESTLSAAVRYLVRRTGEEHTVRVERAAG
jgi:phage baseplate assembly protein W